MPLFKGPHRTPLWILRALTALVAFGFAMPSCMTSSVWRDDRTHARQLRARSPELHAFRTTGRPDDCVLQLPPAAAVRLHQLEPSVPAQCEWLLVRPRVRNAALRVVLALGATKGWTMSPRLLALEAPEFAHPQLSIGVDPLPDYELHGVTGVNWTANGIFKHHWIDVPCDLTALSERPQNLGEELVSFSFDHEVVQDDGTPIWKRAAISPLTLALDAAMSPFEVIYYLTP